MKLSKKILVVGTGGIGNEILKLLTARKEKYVHLIDMDTITLTNLNRQFFFKKEDVGKYKCNVIRDCIDNFYNKNRVYTNIYEANNNERIELNDNILSFAKENKKLAKSTNFDIEKSSCNKYHIEEEKCIKKKKFSAGEINVESNSNDKNEYQIRATNKTIQEMNLEFYMQFDVIFSCLDNVKTRKHLSLITQFIQKFDGINGSVKPILIDGGSSGFLGQSFFVNGYGNCYDMIEEENELNEEAICTIRTKPTNFKHCLIWTNEFFRIEYINILQNINEKKSNIEFKEAEHKNDDIFDQKLCDKVKNTEEHKKTSNKCNIIFDQNICDEKQKPVDHRVKTAKLKNILVDENITNKFENIEKTNYFELYFKDMILQNLDFKIESKFYIDKLNEITAEILEKWGSLDKFVTPFDLIYNVSCIRAISYDIDLTSKINAETMIKKIIPSISTTNSIIASLMVYQYDMFSSFFEKSINKDYQTQKNQFLNAIPNFYLAKNKKIVNKLYYNIKENSCMTCKSEKWILNVSKTEDYSYTTEKLMELLINQGIFHESVINDISIVIKGEIIYDKLLCSDIDSKFLLPINDIINICFLKRTILIYCNMNDSDDIISLVPSKRKS